MAEALLRDCQLLIGPPGDRGDSHPGYLVMVGLDGKFVSNQTVDIKVHGFGPAAEGAKTGATLSFGDSAVIPEEVELVLSVRDGSLAIRGSDKLYAFLYKDHAASAVAAAAWHTPGQ